MQVGVGAPGIVTVVDLDSSGAQVSPFARQHARAYHTNRQLCQDRIER